MHLKIGHPKGEAVEKPRNVPSVILTPPLAGEESNKLNVTFFDRLRLFDNMVMVD
jgi:hypothetical protein